MINFNDFFEIKYAPSYPGPNADENYVGLSTSDNNLFVKYSGSWYKVLNPNAVRLKEIIETSCNTAEDIDMLVKEWETTMFLEKI